MIDQRKAPQTSQPIDYAKHEELLSEVEQWLKDGGQIKQINAVDNRGATYTSDFYDKPKEELAAIARRHKRPTFLYLCEDHGHYSHRAKDAKCVKCSNIESKNNKARTHKDIRAEAKKRKQTTYFGKPCRTCHKTERYTSNLQCVVCAK